MDEIILMHEVIYSIKVFREEIMWFILGMQKAYDGVYWKFLDQVI